MIVTMFIFGVVTGIAIGGLGVLAGRLQAEVDKAAKDGDRR
jgi:hypothetical protein